jgi:hypothetical protein
MALEMIPGKRPSSEITPTQVTANKESLDHYDDPMPQFAREWVAELAESYPQWPVSSIKAIVEMYLKNPGMFDPAVIAKWRETQLPDDLANPPREGVIVTYPVDSPEHAALEAATADIARQQTAEIVYSDKLDG